MSDGARCFYCKKSPCECKELCRYCGYAVPNHNPVCIQRELDATRALLTETREQLVKARKDTERLDEVEARGMTVEHRGSIGKSVDPWLVRVSTSTHKALTYWTGKTAREAIDAAMGALRAKQEAEEKGTRGSQMNKPRVVAALQAVAGLAAAAAQDAQDGKFWPGELSASIQQMRQQLDAASREIGDDR